MGVTEFRDVRLTQVGSKSRSDKWKLTNWQSVKKGEGNEVWLLPFALKYYSNRIGFWYDLNIVLTSYTPLGCHSLGPFSL